MLPETHDKCTSVEPHTPQRLARTLLDEGTANDIHPGLANAGMTFLFQVLGVHETAGELDV